MNGLLEPMAGLFSGVPEAPQDPFEQALRKRTMTALGMGLLARSGPSLQPQSFGSAFGQAGMGAVQQADQMRAQQAQQQMAQQQLMLQAANASRAGVPAGYQRTPQGLAPIPGGPADPAVRASMPQQRPADIEVYEYYESLSPEERALFERTQRGPERTTSAVEQALFDSSEAAFKANQNVARYENLADRMQTILPAAGVGAKWTEALKEMTGNEDATTLLRKEWNELRVSNAVQNLPPGVASDKDIELVMSAYLPEFANAEVVASFMRGLSKLERLKAQYHEFESDYLSRTRSPVGLSRAWKEHIEGQQPAGQGGFRVLGVE